MKIPDYMPLDSLGLITCATCHDPHINRLDNNGKKTYYLRTDKRGKQFCLLCHEDPKHPGEVSIFSARNGLTHRRSMNLAHGFRNFTAAASKKGLDPLTRMCIGCHGPTESDVSQKWLAKGIWTMGSGIGLSHPVGVNYEDAAWNNKEIVPLKKLDPRIKLFGGRIGCCTCHNPYSPGGGLGLVIGDKNSYQDLCMACHNV
ncbi:MAG: cytochrome c3 family protein [Nitrospirota bacterium]